MYENILFIKANYEQMRALGVTLAYLIYDLVCCWYDKNLKIDNLVHHLVCIVGIGIGLAHERVPAILNFNLSFLCL